MGLMFIFPVDESETERVSIKNQAITIKTYGLPMIFWGYLVAASVVISAMFIGVKGPMKKLYETGDMTNQVLVVAALATLILIPVVTLCFYMYEKFITKKGDTLTITHRLFFIPIFKKSYTLESSNSFTLEHFMDSPNVAKMQQDPTMRGFENKGYFELFAKLSNGKHIRIDRSNRKADLKKMITLLSKF